jgi:Ca2+-binding RTX toxin-like protein
VIQGQDYAPVSYDETSEFITLYTLLGPDNQVTITETRPVSISVWSAGGTIDARRAGPAAEVVGRGSLFELDRPAPITFRGGPGNDVFFGTKANDVAKGGGGLDQLNGEAGRDRLSARDGKRDIVDCGKGRDKAKIDKREALLSGCEAVKRPR